MQLHKDKEVFQEIILATAEAFNFQDFQIEKDYYVSYFLKHLKEVSPNIVFKGGTSLSKCYDIIDRFSEDIDLTFQFEEEKLGGAKLKKQQKPLISAITNTIETLNFQLNNGGEIFSGRYFNKYEVGYESIFEERGYMLDHILIETTLTYKPYPCEKMLVSNYITKFLTNEGETELIKQYALEPFEMQVQTVERTFIDKIFAICDYHLIAQYHGKSRHLYDIHKIYKSGVLKENILNDLVPQIIETRRNGPNTYSCEEGRKPIDILNEIISKDVFKEDYETVTKEFLSQYVAYREILDTLTEILDRGWIPEIICLDSESIVK